MAVRGVVLTSCSVEVPGLAIHMLYVCLPVCTLFLLCMFICLCTLVLCVFACVHACSVFVHTSSVCVFVHTWSSMCVCLCAHLFCVCVGAHMVFCVCLPVCTLVLLCVCLFACMHTVSSVYVCLCVHTCSSGFLTSSSTQLSQSVTNLLSSYIKKDRKTLCRNQSTGEGHSMGLAVFLHLSEVSSMATAVSEPGDSC